MNTSADAEHRRPRVGIITLHYVDNLGGVLLAFALQEAVAKLGYDSELIDYDPTQVSSPGKHIARTLARRLRKLPGYVRDLPGTAKALRSQGALSVPSRHEHRSSGTRGERFQRFRDECVRVSPTRYASFRDLAEEPPVYDAYVIGSDQVWNPYLLHEDAPVVDPAYFLDFAAPARRIAYAVSIAIPRVPDHLRAPMTEHIKAIPHVSVRERTGGALVRELTGRNPEVVSDPVLLHDADFWRGLAVRPQGSRPYLLCYFLGEGQEYREAARRIATRLGLDIVLVSRNSTETMGQTTTTMHDVGPREFLGLVEGARFVCTDSYHGTLFSLIFQRPFLAFRRPGSDGRASMVSRIDHILSVVGLDERVVETAAQSDAIASLDEVDFSAVGEALGEYTKKSRGFLATSLSECCA